MNSSVGIRNLENFVFEHYVLELHVCSKLSEILCMLDVSTVSSKNECFRSDTPKYKILGMSYQREEYSHLLAQGTNFGMCSNLSSHHCLECNFEDSIEFFDSCNSLNFYQTRYLLGENPEIIGKF